MSADILIFPNSNVQCRPERDMGVATSGDWTMGMDSEYAWGDSMATVDEAEELKARCISMSDAVKKSDRIFMELIKENQVLKSQLEREMRRSHKYRIKLKFIQDNGENFEYLKEAYLNYNNQAATRPLVEIREKSCQTIQGIYCKSCIETSEFRRRLNMQEDSDKYLLIKKDDLTLMRKTFDNLKQNFVNSESENLIRDQKEVKYRKSILDLKEENQRFKNTIEGKQREINELRADLGHRSNTSTEICALRKVVAKLEKRLLRKEESKTKFGFSDTEKKMIRHIGDRHHVKKYKRSSYFTPRGKYPPEEREDYNSDILSQ